MSPEMGNPPPGSRGIQFDKAEFGDSAIPVFACAACGKPVGDYYFEINGKTVCGDCKQRVEARFTKGLGTQKILRAVGAGSLAALLGFGIYFIIKAATGYEFGLIAVLIGVMVGAAVRWGSGGSGGWLYQTMAMFLTYNSITLTYVHIDPDEWMDHFASHLAEAYVLPFTMGFQNVVGLIILAFGLYQAWRINKKARVEISGPYRASPKAPPPA
jgi:hypothetical protein